MFITAGSITKLFAWGEGDSGGHVLREMTSRGRGCVGWSAHHTLVNVASIGVRSSDFGVGKPVLCVFITAGPCVFITAVPITKLFAWGEGDSEDMCYDRRQAEACVN